MRKAFIVCLNTWGLPLEKVEAMSDEELLTLLKKLNKEEYGKEFEPNRDFLIATVEVMVWHTTQWLKNGASVRYESDVDIAIEEFGIDLEKDDLEMVVDKLYDSYRKCLKEV